VGDSLIPGASVDIAFNFSAETGKSKYRVYAVVKTGNVYTDPNLTNNFAKAVVGVNHPPLAQRIFITAHAGSNSVTNSISAFISDPDLDSLHIKIGSIPTAKGSLRLVGSQLIYQPSQTYIGTFVVPYYLKDGRGGSAGSVITVSVLPGVTQTEHGCRGFVRAGC
jgi:hypothetical protein